jgi:phage shock protein E
MNLETIIKDKNTIIIDVRTPAEFMGGNVVGSINIPLQEIPDRLNEIKKINAPIVLCCAAGGRSAQAHIFLVQQGIDCHNGGSWFDVNYYLNN